MCDSEREAWAAAYKSLQDNQFLKAQLQRMEQRGETTAPAAPCVRENLQEFLELNAPSDVLSKQVGSSSQQMEPPPGFPPLKQGHVFIQEQHKAFPNTVFGTIVNTTNAGATEEKVRKDKEHHRKVQKQLHENMEKRYPSKAQRKTKRRKESQARREIAEAEHSSSEYFVPARKRATPQSETSSKAVNHKEFTEITLRLQLLNRCRKPLVILGGAHHRTESSLEANPQSERGATRWLRLLA